MNENTDISSTTPSSAVPAPSADAPQTATPQAATPPKEQKEPKPRRPEAAKPAPVRRDWSKARLPAFAAALDKDLDLMTDEDRYALLKDLHESLSNLRDVIPSYFRNRFEMRIRACEKLMRTM